MKLLLLLSLFFVVSGCTSTPKKVLMKNCDHIGNNFYSCEEVPKKDLTGAKNL